MPTVFTSPKSPVTSQQTLFWHLFGDKHQNLMRTRLTVVGKAPNLYMMIENGAKQTDLVAT